MQLIQCCEDYNKVKVYTIEWHDYSQLLVILISFYAHKYGRLVEVGRPNRVGVKG